MSYPTLVTVSVVLALLAAAVAGAVAVLTLGRRRRWRDRGIGVILPLLVGAAMFGFLASAEGDHDLQRQTRLVLSLAARAERTEHARFGHYTASPIELSRLSPELGSEIRDDGAWVVAVVGRFGGLLRLQASLGFGTSAQATVSNDRSEADVATVYTRRPRL